MWDENTLLEVQMNILKAGSEFREFFFLNSVKIIN